MLSAIKTGVLTRMMPVVAAAGTPDVFTNMMDLFSKGLVVFGGIVCVVGIIGVSQGLKDHSGGQMNSGIGNLVSGALVVLAAAILKTITF